MEESSSFFDIVLYLGYFLVIVAAISAVVLPLIKSFGNPRSLLIMGVGILVLSVIFLIGYALADSEVMPYFARYEIDGFGGRLIGGALITMYILIGVALLSIAFTEVSKLFR